MALLLPIRRRTPRFGHQCYLAPNATVIGDVVMGDQCSVWFQAVVRGDVNKIRIGHRVNIQDGAVLHCTYERTELHIGDDVSIGHRAIVHGCHIDSESLIGMGAIVMDKAHVPSRCLVAAGAVVTEGKVLESGWIYAGVPAKKLKPLSDAYLEAEVKRIAGAYIKYAGWFRAAE